MAYLHPGVYIEEIPSGSKPIEGVGTSTAAFIGYTTKGPIGEPQLISKWDDYEKEFGGIRNLDTAPQGDPMGLSVSAFFQNGGKKAYIVRITQDWKEDDTPIAFDAKKAEAYVDNPETTGKGTGTVLKFTAVNEGEWANGLVVKLEGSLIDSSLYDVEVGRYADGDPEKFSSIESFAGVSLDLNEPLFIKNVIDGVSELVTVDLVDAIPSSETSSDYLGTSTSGDLGSSFSLDLSGKDKASRTLSIALDGHPAIKAEIPGNSYADLAAVAAEIQSTVRGGDSVTTERRKNFTCVAKDNKLVLTSGTRQADSSVVVTHESVISKSLKLGVAYIATSTSGDTGSLTFPLELGSLSDTERTLAVEIDDQDPISHIIPSKFDNTAAVASPYPTLGDIAAEIGKVSGLSCIAEDNKLVLTSDTNTASSAVVVAASGIAAKLMLTTATGLVELTGQQYHDRNCGVEKVGQDNAEKKDVLDGGVKGSKPLEDDYDDVFTKFIKYRDINIICVPGQHWSKDSSGNAVVQKAIAHAEKMKNRMVIVDPPPNHELENSKFVKDMELPSQTYCVVYYPWVEVANRFYHAERFPGLPKTVLVPPSGYAAGMWARIDGKRGVWKAPAGMETGLLGLAGLEHKIEDSDQDALNPWGVNCLRSMPGAGKVIWGARTRATKADPEWRYVPVRRTAIMIEESIYNGIQWAVFEPNDYRLWSALRANIGAFMNGLFRVGAFQGEKASDAYFVRCGLGDTMTQGEIDAGQVIVVVGFAPLKPAEFVIVRIQQKVNQQ